MYKDGEFAAVARMLALTAHDGDYFNTIHLVLGLIRELMEHKPEWVQPIPVVAAGSDQELHLGYIKWLAEEGILKLRDGNVRLTAEGRRTLAVAAGSYRLLSEFLGGCKGNLDRYEANRALVLILCTHYNLRNQKNETDRC